LFLLGFADRLLEALFPGPAVLSGASAITLGAYVELIVRRSRTTYTTLLAALYYLALFRSISVKLESAAERQEDVEVDSKPPCQRRMFLAALMLSSKYTQDRNFSSRSWATISGLRSNELNANEALFLATIDWRLYIPPMSFQRWATEVSHYAMTPELTLPNFFVFLAAELDFLT